MERLGMNLGSATNLHHQQVAAASSFFNSTGNWQGSPMLDTYVLTRVDTASAMAIVIASSLLIGNLLPLLEV